MEVVATRASWRAATESVRSSGGRVGLVPTMGALHAGHRSLVEAARSRGDVVAATIFVNPLQFGDAHDLERYPRTLESDLALLESAGCDLVFTPSVAELYPRAPEPATTMVRVAGAAEGFEGADRPGHFDGVATVVALLFNLTGPCDAYFGEKDFQQLAVIRQMVAELAMDVDVQACPTLREPDGLAMSSRNVRLSADGRAIAPLLYRSLLAAAAEVMAGAGPAAASQLIGEMLGAEPRAQLSYAALVDPVTLEIPQRCVSGADYRLLIAAVIDGVRLIDNLEVTAGIAP